MIKFIIPAIILTVTIGCTPRVVVRSNPTAHDKGIRYYRPKPYLKIEPAEIGIAKDKTQLVPSLVRISLVYLPDFAEEYAIDVRTGFGTADVGIKLEDGWNLTEISQDLDSQTDENLEAIGSLIGEIGGIVPTSRASGAEKMTVTVEATNVPIGFYESVIGRDGCGRKRLYGFRYLGFVPYSACPIEMTGHEHALCGDGCAPLYGLAFEAGRMVFKPLVVMASEPVGATPPFDENKVQTNAPADQQDIRLPAPRLSTEAAEIELLAYMNQRYAGTTGALIDSSGDRPRVEIRTSDSAPDEEVIRSVLRWWDQTQPIDAATLSGGDILIVR